MTARIARLGALLEEPLLVTAPANVLYLTGFRSSNAALLVEPERARLFSDFRYAEAGREVEGVEFVESARSLAADLAERLCGRVGFEADAVSCSSYETLAAGGRLELVPRRGLVERLRAVKDETELALIRRAAAITDDVYAAIAADGLVGRAEREVAWRIEVLFRERGAEEISFDVTVGSGPNGSKPHARAGDRVIGRGEAVVVDAGCVVGGYCSDCTRTFATGLLPERLREAYAMCLAAQLAGLEAVRPGRRGVEVDAEARAVVEASAFAGRFGHGLGHGVGLEVHEAPRLSPLATEDDVLAPGNVVTVEPGIYLPGLGGIRIEDLVVVTDGGAEVLSSFPKELTTVD